MVAFGIIPCQRLLEPQGFVKDLMDGFTVIGLEGLIVLIDGWKWRFPLEGISHNVINRYLRENRVTGSSVSNNVRGELVFSTEGYIVFDDYECDDLDTNLRECRLNNRRLFFSLQDNTVCCDWSGSIFLNATEPVLLKPLNATHRFYPSFSQHK